MFDINRTIQQLADECRISGTNFYRPHAEQSIRALPAFVDAMTECELPLVVLAIDGVHYDIATICWTPHRVGALTSTFPSTSSVAWLSSTTGFTATLHGVPGVVWSDPVTNRMVHCFTDTAWVPPVCPTFFETSRCAGPRVACLGDLWNWRGSWLDAVLRGADRLSPDIDWSGIRMRPQDIADWAVLEVNRGLELDPRILWIFVNFDDYIHWRGYDDDLRKALVKLNGAAHQWNRRGVNVIAYSDHGMAEVARSDDLARRWAQIHVQEGFAYPTGGAGRTRWSYIPDSRAAEFQDRLRQGLGDQGCVWQIDELVRMGALDCAVPKGASFGNVCALACGAAFPVTDPHLPFNHGSLTYNEMFVPLAAWDCR